MRLFDLFLDKSYIKFQILLELARGTKRQSVNKIFSGDHKLGAPPRMPI
jgi:hypothetical protein